MWSPPYNSLLFIMRNRKKWDISCIYNYQQDSFYTFFFMSFITAHYGTIHLAIECNYLPWKFQNKFLVIFLSINPDVNLTLYCWNLHFFIFKAVIVDLTSIFIQFITRKVWKKVNTECKYKRGTDIQLHQLYSLLTSKIIQKLRNDY